MVPRLPRTSAFPRAGALRARAIGRVWALVAAALVATVLAGCDDGAPAPGPTGAGGRTVSIIPVENRVPAPELSGELLDGTAFDPGAIQGNVVVVNFWGSWCGPCVAEADDLEQTYQATKNNGVAFLGINVRDTRDAATAFASERSTYPSIFDPAGKLVLGFEVPPLAIPSTVIIDRDGRVAVMINRGVVRDELEPIVAQIATEPRSP